MELHRRGKTWWDGGREDMKRFGLFQEDALEWNKWRMNESRGSTQLAEVHVENGCSSRVGFNVPPNTL